VENFINGEVKQRLKNLLKNYLLLDIIYLRLYVIINYLTSFSVYYYKHSFIKLLLKYFEKYKNIC
jgi:hypothetical protein